MNEPGTSSALLSLYNIAVILDRCNMNQLIVKCYLPGIKQLCLLHKWMMC